MDKLSLDAPSETPSQGRRVSRLRHVAAICACVCIGLCLASYLIGSVRESALHSLKTQRATNTLETIDGTSSYIDYELYRKIDYISASVGVLGCLVGWTVPIMQVAGFGRPLDLHLTRTVTVVLSGVVTVLVAAVLTLPWLIDILNIPAPPVLHFSNLNPTPRTPWPFYGAYRVLLVVFECYIIAAIFITISISIHKICTALIDAVSPKEAELPVVKAAEASKTMHKALPGCLTYVLFYIFLFLCSFWYVVIIG